MISNDKGEVKFQSGSAIILTSELLEPCFVYKYSISKQRVFAEVNEMAFGYLFLQASVLSTCKATNIYFFNNVNSFQD